MPTWLSIILALGGSTLISLVVSSLWNSSLKKINKLKELEKKEVEEKYKKEQLERQKKWEEEVLAIIEPLNSKIDSIKLEMEENKKATVSSLRADMMILKDKYTKRDFASPEDKAAWNQLYKDYSAQGGNHFKEYVSAWKNQINNLPENITYSEFLRDYFDEYSDKDK